MTDYMIKAIPTNGIELTLSGGMSITLGTEIYALPTGMDNFIAGVHKQKAESGTHTRTHIPIITTLAGSKLKKHKRGNLEY